MSEEVTLQHDSAVTKTFGKLAIGYGQRTKKPRPFQCRGRGFLAVHERTVQSDVDGRSFKCGWRTVEKFAFNSQFTSDSKAAGQVSNRQLCLRPRYMPTSGLACWASNRRLRLVGVLNRPMRPLKS